MTDAELIESLRLWNWDVAADRIELLEYMNKTILGAVEQRDATIEALTKELDHWEDVAGREGVCMTCRGPYGAPEPYGCTDCLNTGYCGEHHNTVADLEAKLAKAEAGLREIAAEASVPVHTWKNGINFKKMYEGWRKIAVERIDIARTALAEIKGESRE